MDDHIATGATRRGRAQGAKHEGLHAALGTLDPRLPQWADGWIFGQVWGDDAEFHDRMLVAIVALAATNKPGQLKNYLHGALQDGMDPRRIHEALVMLVVYVGFPTAIQALVVWQEVVTAARRNGMTVDVPVQ
jgi:4-carboxymuconolactone decarboxylase